ncbi:MAG: hypothetical protein WDO18_08290, partial [Acidobacteriota bacterium]
MRQTNVGRLFFLIFALIVCSQVFLPPAVGSANNADFGKIAGAFDLAVPQEGNEIGRFAYLHYVADPRFHLDSGFRSSESLLFRAALGLNRIFGQPSAFDLRFLGVVHAAIFLGTFWLFLPALETTPRRIAIPILVLLTFLFSDVMYVAYFNSIFMDTAGLLFGLATIVFGLRAFLWNRPVDRWLLVLAAILMVTSKAQHYPLGIIVAAFLLWKADRLFGPIAAALILIASAFSSHSAPANYAAAGCYTVIFSQLLPDSTDVSGDLYALGLDPTARPLIGTHAYSNDSGLRDPKFARRFERQVSYGKLGWFLLQRPRQALDLITTRLSEAGRQRPARGNFDPSAGFPPFAESKSFALASQWKATVFEGRGARYLSYALALIAAALALAATSRTALAPIAALCATYLTALAVAALADNLDAERHFLLFDALGDTLLITTVYLAASTVSNIAMRKITIN